MDLSLFQGIIGGAVSAGLLSGPMKTVEDLWYLSFGHYLDEKVETLKAKHSINLELYKKTLIEELVNIPNDDLKEPALDVVGPALEASKYYIEEDKLRTMFSKLISSSMRKSKTGIVRSSFVEIIKQLIPEDAILLKQLYENPNSEVIVNIKLVTKIANTNYAKHVILNEDTIQNHSKTESSINNLIRLGLITISYNGGILGEEHEKKYSQFFQSNIYKSAVKSASSMNEIVKKEKTSESLLLFGDSEAEVMLDKGFYELTSFGRDFCISCL